MADEYRKMMRRESEEEMEAARETLRKHPPLTLGGQGRSAREIQSDASALVLTLGIGLLLVVCLCVGGCQQ